VIAIESIAFLVITLGRLTHNRRGVSTP
jgi:hypothetical protein